jgi:hypothetical protein
MSSRIARNSALLALLVISVTAGLTTAVGASVTHLSDVTRVVRGPVNVEQAFRVKHCIIHYEFGTFDGVAYARARSTHEDRGYVCTVQSQVIAARGSEVVTGTRSLFTCGARHLKPCDPGVYLRWAQSSVPNAVGFAAQLHVNDIRSWPPPNTWQKDFVTLSAL